MIPIFINFGFGGEEEEVEISEECNDPGKIKELLEKKYPEYVFDEESLEGLEYGSEVKAQVSFKCYEGKSDYSVLKIGNDLSKMYIESRESLNFGDSDFIMSDLEGYDCCVTKLNFIWCRSLKSLEGCPDGVTKLGLEWCESLESLEGCPKGVTKLDLKWCRSLESLEGCPEGVTELDLRGCKSLPKNNDHIPTGCEVKR